MTEPSAPTPATTSVSIDPIPVDTAPKTKLTLVVPNVRTALKMWSMRLNLAASLAVAYVLASPDVLLQVLNALPPEMRAVFPPFVGVALFALVAVARLVKQEKLNGNSTDKS